MSATRPPSRPVWPEWSTEGQTRFRSRKPAWPSVSIGLVPRIRVVRVDLSSQAQVQRTAARRGDRLITNSPCRCTMGPGRLPVELTHQMSPEAAVPWGGSFCFPLMAPRMTPDFDEIATLVASQPSSRLSVNCTSKGESCTFLNAKNATY